jgi:hypothetical protein
MSRWASDTKEKAERAPRYAISMALSYRRPGETVWHKGKVENISRTGVLFRVEELMDPGALIEMTFQLPVEIGGESGARVLCVGNVVRTVMPPSSDQPPAMAALIHSYKFVHKMREPEA